MCGWIFVVGIALIEFCANNELKSQIFNVRSMKRSSQRDHRQYASASLFVALSRAQTKGSYWSERLHLFGTFASTPGSLNTM